MQPLSGVRFVACSRVGHVLVVLVVSLLRKSTAPLSQEARQDTFTLQPNQPRDRTRVGNEDPILKSCKPSTEAVLFQELFPIDIREAFYLADCASPSLSAQGTSVQQSTRS